MGKKYEKPAARNLGEMLPAAEGYCLTVGNSANTPLPGSDCVTGGSATGAQCATGGKVNVFACSSGSHPKYFGCTVGNSASAHCSTGSLVI